MQSLTLRAILHLFCKYVYLSLCLFFVLFSFQPLFSVFSSPAYSYLLQDATMPLLLFLLCHFRQLSVQSSAPSAVHFFFLLLLLAPLQLALVLLLLLLLLLSSFSASLFFLFSVAAGFDWSPCRATPRPSLFGAASWMPSGGDASSSNGDRRPRNRRAYLAKPRKKGKRSGC